MCASGGISVLFRCMLAMRYWPACHIQPSWLDGLVAGMNFVRNEGNFHYELVGKTVVAHEGLTGQCALRIVTTYPDNYIQYRSLRPVWPMLPKYLAGAVSALGALVADSASSCPILAGQTSTQECTVMNRHAGSQSSGVRKFQFAIIANPEMLHACK